MMLALWTDTDVCWSTVKDHQRKKPAIMTDSFKRVQHLQSHYYQSLSYSPLEMNIILKHITDSHFPHNNIKIILSLLLCART